ncbi:MAG TPA: PilZ domain-containing protein [Sphingomonas sp.]|jgi:hypothetical protein|nr:PilZ domain-containing protein [Sphingomonas sp.]
MQSSHDKAMLTAASFHDQRREMRSPVAVFLRSVTVNKRSVEMTDISEHGCLLEQSVHLPQGSAVILTIATFLPIRATVAWSAECAVGLQFDSPLDPSIVDYIAGGMKQ